MSRATANAYPSVVGDPGLTIREEFAKAAMQGLNANPDWADESQARRTARAVADADALLAELAKAQS